jgi:hypothetical protein
MAGSACRIEEFAMKTAKFIISIFCLVTIMAFLAETGDAADCNVTKGTLVVSPGELQFYVTQEQLTNPEPITVQVNGFAHTANDTKSTLWEVLPDFCWVASKSNQWITLNGNPDSVAESTNGGGPFYVGVDINQLLRNQNIYGGNVTKYEGNVTVTATISTDPDTIPTTSIGILVKVYVNALREAAEKSVATTDWLDLVMNVPVTEDISGPLYVLAEHPSLAAEDIQNTPIAIPFSSDNSTATNPGNPVIPYAPTDVSDNDQDAPNIKAFIPSTFGGGLRLIGMEGDWIIRRI